MKDINPQIQKSQQVPGRITNPLLDTYELKLQSQKRKYFKCKQRKKDILSSKKKQLENFLKISSKLLEKITASLESYAQK